MNEKRNVKIVTTKQFNYDNFKEILEQIDGVTVYDKITSNIHETLEGTFIAKKEFFNNFLIVLDDYVGESEAEDNRIFNLLSNALTGPDVEIMLVMNRDAFNKYYKRIADLGITNVYTPEKGSDTTDGNDVREVFNRKFKMPKQWIAQYRGNKMDYIDASIQNKSSNAKVVSTSQKDKKQELSINEIDSDVEDLNDLFGSTISSNEIKEIKQEPKQSKDLDKKFDKKVTVKKESFTSNNINNKKEKFNGNKIKNKEKLNISKQEKFNKTNKKENVKPVLKDNKIYNSNKDKGDKVKNNKANLEIHTFVKNTDSNFLHNTMKKIISKTNGNKSNIYVILNGEYSTISKTTSLDILDEFLKTQSAKSAKDLVFDSVTESGLGFDTISRLEGKGGVLTSINEILDILSSKYDNIFVIGDINAIANIENHNKSVLYLDSKLNIYNMKDSLTDICSNLSNNITKNIKLELF